MESCGAAFANTTSVRPVAITLECGFEWLLFGQISLSLVPFYQSFANNRFLNALMERVLSAQVPVFRNCSIVFQKANVRGPTLFARSYIYSGPQIHVG